MTYHGKLNMSIWPVNLLKVTNEVTGKIPITSHLLKSFMLSCHMGIATLWFCNEQNVHDLFIHGCQERSPENVEHKFMIDGVAEYLMLGKD